MNYEIEFAIKELNTKYLTQVKRILINKSYIFTKFREATPTEDMNYGFDAVLSFPDVKIPVRIRKFQYLKFMDLTIRSKSRYGLKTEIDKLKEGFGDFYFYAWSNEENTKIMTYMVLNLEAFRNTVINSPTWANKSNNDGTFFHTYSMKALLENRIVVILENIF